MGNGRLFLLFYFYAAGLDPARWADSCSYCFLSQQKCPISWSDNQTKIIDENYLLSLFLDLLLEDLVFMQISFAQMWLT